MKLRSEPINVHIREFQKDPDACDQREATIYIHYKRRQLGIKGIPIRHIFLFHSATTHIKQPNKQIGRVEILWKYSTQLELERSITRRKILPRSFLTISTHKSEDLDRFFQHDAVPIKKY